MGCLRGRPFSIWLPGELLLANKTNENTQKCGCVAISMQNAFDPAFSHLNKKPVRLNSAGGLCVED